MNAKDDFYGMADESSRLLARQAEPRGLGGGRTTPKLTDPRALPSSPLPLPPAPLGTRAGQGLRSGFTRASNTAIDALETGTNLMTAPGREVAGVVRDFTRAVAGQRPGADAGQALPGLTLPRIGRAGPAAPAATAAPTPRGGRPFAETMRSPAAPALTPGATNTFTGSDGRTVAVEPSEPAATPPVTAPTTPRLTRASNAPDFDAQGIARQSVGDLRNVAQMVRSDAASGLNPMGADAEIMRRLEHSQSSYFNKGRPSARAAQAQAYLGQLDARHGASAAFQQGAGQVIAGGAEGAVQEGLDAQDNVARARLQRSGIQGQLQLQREDAARPTLLPATDDGILRLRRGGTAAAITDENGQPLHEARSAPAGTLTPQDLLKAYTAEREAIQASLGTAEEKAAAMSELESNPLYLPLVGRSASVPPNLEAFLQTARAANPNASDQELRNYYQAEYGSP